MVATRPLGQPASPDRPSRERPHAVPVWVRPLATVFVWGAALVLFLRFFAPVQFVLLGFLAAAAVAAMLRPLMRRLRGPRALRATLLGLGLAGVLAGVLALGVWAVTKPLKEEMANWPQTEAKFNEFLQRGSQRFGMAETPTVQGLIRHAGGFLTGQRGADLLAYATHTLTALLIALAFIFFGSVYLLAETPGRLTDGAARLLPPRRRPPFRGMIDDLQPRLRWWMLGTFVSMTVTGVLSGVGYKLVGLEFAFGLALLAALGELVPTVGPLLTFLVALMFAATQGTGAIAGVVVVYVIVQTVESYVLLPWVMNKAVDIPPVATLFTLVLWGKVFGVAGLLLAIPINLVLWTAAERFVIGKDRPDRPPPGGATEGGSDGSPNA